MKDISNSTLALLVVMAIVVSVFGTLLSITKLGDIGITGFASTSTTDTGTANVSIPSSAYINLTDDVISLDTVATRDYNDSEDKDDYFIIRNDGNVNLSIEVYDSGQTTTYRGNWMGGGPFVSGSPDAGDCLSTNPATCLQVSCINSSFADVVDCNNTYYPMPNSSTVNMQIIRSLGYKTNNDTAWIGINMSVPGNEPGGKRETTAITFEAVETA